MKGITPEAQEVVKKLIDGMRTLNMRAQDWDGVERPEITNQGIKEAIKRIKEEKI